ncbi:MAG: CAP domain-containing protein [Fimbriimonadaceae bacterium]|uniref:SCP domain-containing protein n=1 Tax=Candidatus Nitrosymbiomonas proteolyticus TaxID=2608984 RepID=A0A809RUQ6_9BACT|nr:CAP domain-containing protein [Fimbriimonadaceae bacterium]NUM38768.1 CAP domain-containing protein [Armatimonadota bacterium]BBO23532.1 conserved hypothetical protein [Candidatus Nitrosymbiomonas proteolyticus]
MSAASLSRIGVGVLLAWATLAHAEVKSGLCGPTGNLLSSNVTLMWEVWSTGADRIVRGVIELNGEPIPAVYDVARLAVRTETPLQLAPGNYEVVARAVFERGFAVRSNWRFTVGLSAMADLPEPSSNQLELQRAVNDFRLRVGLPPVYMHPSLAVACQSHSEYNLRNQTTGHYEKPESQGFTGATPIDRAESFGFLGGTYEAVSCGSWTPEDALAALVDGPYHRLPILQPGELAFGAGVAEDRVTLQFSLTQETGVSIYPYEGQRDVPVRWNRLERPNPLRIHGKAIVGVGYPITFAYYRRGKDRLTVIDARLLNDSDEPVATYLNTPDNDKSLRNALILIPQDPLIPGRKYRVEVQATAEDGSEFVRRWSFETAPQ